MWRPPSPSVSVSAGKVRAGLRSVAYALAALALLSLIQASALLSTSSETLARAAGKSSPRFRRNVLSQDGPLAELGTTPPAVFAQHLFISVKTTAKYHATRLQDILHTWFRLAPSKIWFFTDAADPEISEQTDGHLVVTNCSASHRRQALCCKMGVEFDYFLRSGKRWMCHFDDDNYVNVVELERMLSTLDPREEIYVGRPSTREPITIPERRDGAEGKATFWFATGGAGFCLSQALAKRAAPLAANGGLERLGEEIRLPDDVTVGYLLEHLLKSKLRVEERFHSHLESMGSLERQSLHSQVSLSAGSYSDALNVVDVPVLFQNDFNRFRSLHCFLFPNAAICPKPLTSP